MAGPIPQTFEEALLFSRRILSSSDFILRRGGLESEAEQIVIGAFRAVTGRGKTFSRNDLHARVLDAFPAEAGEKVIEWSKKRAAGEPLQYLLGYQYFLNHEYLVDRTVLIPRPETEILADHAIRWLRNRPEDPRLGIEIGLGSGILSIELLRAFTRLRMEASEISEGARALTQKNAERILGSLERIDIRAPASAQDVLEPFHYDTRAIDFIISNPPYLIGESEADEDVMAHEPAQALFAPPSDPLYFYRKIALGAPKLLRMGGAVFLECPHERFGEIHALFAAYQTESVPDLHGRNRVLRAEWIVNG